MKIEITTNHSRSSYGIPVCIVDGEIRDDVDGLKACMTKLGWTIADLSAHSGKAIDSIKRYRTGRLPVPAEIWNVLRDALEQQAK